MIEELEKRLTPNGIHLNYLESLGLIEYIRKGMLDEISYHAQEEENLSSKHFIFNENGFVESIWLQPGDAVNFPITKQTWFRVFAAFLKAGAKGNPDQYLNNTPGVSLCWNPTGNHIATYENSFIERNKFRVLTPDQVINAENA